MRTFLLLLSLLMISCSQKKSSPDNHNAEGAQAAEFTTDKDSLDIKPSVEFVTGQFDFKTHDNFVRVDPKYADKEMYLHTKTYEAFRAMVDSAKADGISFTLVSGARNFNYQKSIWDRKWNNSSANSDLDKALEILEYSSMPMTSRHHWGTDIDLNNLSNSYFEEGQGKKEYEWLKAHANDFGFYQPYTDKGQNGRTGYNEEKWHWSFIPLADPLLDYYNRHLTNSDIRGFKGAKLATEIDMVKKYVNGVSLKIKEKGK